MDEFDFLARLPNSPFASDSDRYNAFRRVFMSTDEGQMVLKEILSWGKLFKTPIYSSPIDQIALNIATGEKNLAIKLMMIVNNEPPEPPKVTTRKNK